MPADDIVVKKIPAMGVVAIAAHAPAFGAQVSPPGREVWVHEVHDIADAGQQVIKVQLPFRRPDGPPA